jgi:O-methyltransferase
MPLAGECGGPWTAETHNSLYPGNLNQGLVRFIVRYLRPKNFVELGGGVAALANAVANSCELSDSYVIEPSVAVAVSTQRNLHLLNVDVTSAAPPPELDRKFDLVVSIEVAEHIDRSMHERVFDFLAARAGRWVVFSGAHPGQGGHGHVAERPESEWRQEFVSRGLAFDPRMTALVRSLCDAKNINHRVNIQVFRAPGTEGCLDESDGQAKPDVPARLALEPEEPVDATLLRMAAVYRGSAQPSVYLVRGPDGRSLGRGRAEGLISAVRSVESAGLDGAFVEVGVAAGHSSVVAALASSRFIPRDFYLFDTFRGFIDPPDEKDLQGRSIRSYDLSRYAAVDCDSRVVRARMYAAGVPEDRLFVVEGLAETRVADFAPERISILRLDANLYLPTLASLESMYDRLQPGGWLIVSDYGHWQGSRDAVDGFFAKRGTSFAGSAADPACYMMQKP